MPLTMSEERYLEIRREVMRRRLAAGVAEVSAEPGEMTFQTVDALFEHLDTLVPPKDSAPRSRRKRR